MSRAELAEELRSEFEITRRELDELSEEIASAERRLAEFARHDLQVVEIREAIETSRVRLNRLSDRERTLRAKFAAVLADRRDTSH